MAKRKIERIKKQKAYRVFWRDVVSGGQDGGVYERDHIVCLSAETRDRTMKAMIKKERERYPDWEPYTSGRTGETSGPDFDEIEIV